MKGYEEIIKRISALEEQILSGIIKPMNLLEAAAYLGLAPSYIYKLTHKHLIPHYKPTGKRVFFYKKELDEWIVKGNGDTSAASSTSSEHRLSAGFGVMSDEFKEESTSSGSTTSSTGSELRLTTGLLGTKDLRQMELKEKKTK